MLFKELFFFSFRSIQGVSQFMHDIQVLCFSYGELQKMFRHFGEICLYSDGAKYAQQGYSHLEIFCQSAQYQT